MAKEKAIEQEGVVTEALPNVMFRVRLDTNDVVVLCSVCGNMKRNFIKILPGDRVKIEMSPYDLTRGRISQRLGDFKQADQTVDRSRNGKKRK